VRCSTQTHEAVKLDVSAWSALHYVGIQPGYNDQGDPDPREDLELRNCACGSTLCRTRSDR
jgi:hypothetical protein